MEETATPSLSHTLVLELISDLETRQLVVRRFPFLVGRATRCDLVLEQAYVSRLHAEIAWEGGYLRTAIA
jgi:pSer/pThr/pTyr-binding forkhead associated (FHA) protein